MEQTITHIEKKMKYVKIIAEVRPLRPLPPSLYPIGLARTNPPGRETGRQPQHKITLKETVDNVIPASRNASQPGLAGRGIARPPRVKILDAAPQAGIPRPVYAAQRPSLKAVRTPVRITLGPRMRPAIRLHPFSGRVRISKSPLPAATQTQAEHILPFG